MQDLKLKGGGHLKSELLSYKRGRIIEEASHLFYNRGYTGTTLEVLADQLNVTKPFLYSYFKNKEAILTIICETGICESLDALDKALAIDGTYREKLIELVRRVGAVVFDRQEYIVVYQREAKELDRADARRILGMRHEFDVRIAHLLAEGAHVGEFSAGGDSLVSVWIGGLISWIPAWYSPGGRRSRDNVTDQLVDACLRMVGAAELSEAERLETQSELARPVGGK